MAKGKKTGGRVKGTPNKATASTKEVITNVLNAYIESGLLSEDFKQLSAKDRVDAAIRLASFVVPKPQAIDMTLSANVDTTPLSLTLKTLAEENEN